MKKALLVLAIFVFGCATQAPQNNSQETIGSIIQYNSQTIPDDMLCFEQECIQIERALTPTEQSTGLMFRESLCENCGMLFVFQDEKERTFWMKNTLIPLDMVWMDSQKIVVGVTENAVPCKAESCVLYYSPEPAKYVLEINSGQAQKISAQTGKTAVFQE